MYSSQRARGSWTRRNCDLLEQPTSGFAKRCAAVARQTRRIPLKEHVSRPTARRAVPPTSLFAPLQAHALRLSRRRVRRSGLRMKHNSELIFLTCRMLFLWRARAESNCGTAHECRGSGSLKTFADATTAPQSRGLPSVSRSRAHQDQGTFARHAADNIPVLKRFKPIEDLSETCQSLIANSFVISKTCAYCSSGPRGSSRNPGKSSSALQD